MTAVSNTIQITNTDYETLASLANITMTEGKTYSIQVQNLAYFKVADAVFCFHNKEFTFLQGEDDVYVKTNGFQAVITILENV